jgi:hypothetical protein
MQLEMIELSFHDFLAALTQSEHLGADCPKQATDLDAVLYPQGQSKDQVHFRHLF